MDDEGTSRYEEFLEWKKQNIPSPPQPSRITVSEIAFSWPDMRGTFTLSLDGVALEDRFPLSYQMNGRVEFFPPLIHSPLCLPITVSAVELDRKTSAAVQRAVDRIFPVIRAFGRHNGGKIVGYNSSLKRRVIDRAEFEAMQAAIDSKELLVDEMVEKE
jgi:hypothetical protein